MEEWKVRAVKLLWRTMLALLVLLFIGALIGSWISYVTQ